MLKDTPWKDYIKPGRVFGNLYFVGTRPGSVHLIDTGDGLMLIDTGYFDRLYLVINNIWELGFCPADIKYILMSHGHHDHVNGTAPLVAMSGAKTFIGERDLRLLRGELEEACSRPIMPFEPDVLLKDGDVITLGGTRVECVATPGHTAGTMSFFFNVSDGKRTLRAGMFGGAGLNTLNADYFNRFGEPFELRDKYFASLDRLERERVDVFIGNHVWNNDTEGKLERVRAGDTDAFIDPDGWRAFLAECRKKLRDLIESESTSEDKRS